MSFAVQVITPEQIAPVASFPAIVDLLKYILVRTPMARPVPEAISARQAAACTTSVCSPCLSAMDKGMTMQLMHQKDHSPREVTTQCKEVVEASRLC